MVYFNPFRPTYSADPYPTLAAMRAHEPVAWNADLQAWIVTSYRECQQVLDDDDTFSADPVHASGGMGRQTAERRGRVAMGTASILANSDGTRHAALRTIVARAFTPRAIGELQATISANVDRLLDAVASAASFDVMPGLAGPLAVNTVFQLLGIPDEDRGRFREAAMAVMRVRVEGDANPAVGAAAFRGHAELHGLLNRWAQESEAMKGVLRTMIEALAEGMNRDDALIMLIHLATAGNSTTALSIGNAIRALGEMPHIQRELCADPVLIGGAVDELLRFDSATHVITRWTTTAVKLGTRAIPAGLAVHAMVGGASRDPAQFIDPDTIDVRRSVPRPLAFGSGVHACLGAPLARLEIVAAVGGILKRMPGFRVVELKRADTYVLRGLGKLVIAKT